MKRILATTAILALSAGFASAEVTLSGDARMGIIGDFGGADAAFTSRARVKFSMSGTTDGGLEFGASFRADNAKEISDTNTTCVQVADGPDADTELDLVCTSTTTTSGGANAGTAGDVYISGAFGKLSMGDVDGAAQAAVGQVSGVGLTGLGDRNEIRYLGNGGTDFSFTSTADPSALYEYSAGDLSLYLSATNPSGDGDALAVGAKYAFGDFTLAMGYEQAELGFTWNHMVFGATANLGPVVLKAVYGHTTEDAPWEYDQYAISADYTTGALTMTAFISDTEDFASTIHEGAKSSGKHYGLGASYDLGGGASLVGGYVQDQTRDESAFDLGLSFSF